MQIVDLTQIEIRKRQRRNVNSTHINELEVSILARGLFHCPVCWQENQTWILSIGECRLKAIKQIAAKGREFTYDSQVIPPGKIPIQSLAEFLDEAGRFEAELDENVRREKLSWQDEAQAFADLHELRQRQNPQQTFQQTGKELVEKGRFESQRGAQRVQEAVVIAKHLDNPKIASARNATEAFGLVLKQEEEKVNAALARRRLSAVATKPKIEIRHGDCLKILPQLPAGTFDLILTDPPYGIEAGSGGFRSRTVHHHNYTDTVEDAKILALTILTEGFRFTKSRANLFLFTDIKHWDWLQTTSLNMGWTPFRTPVLWQKSDSEGLAPWGSSGFRRTYEVIFYATKGQKGLFSSPTDIIRVNRVPRNERLHAAEKPVELLRKLIECSTLPGEYLLDPCCGSGSSLVAARETKRRALGVEKDLDFYNTAMANVYRPEEQSGV